MRLPSRAWLLARCPSHIDPEKLIEAVEDQTSVVHAVFALGARFEREPVQSPRVLADEDDVIPTASKR